MTLKTSEFWWIGIALIGIPQSAYGVSRALTYFQIWLIMNADL